MNQLKVLLLLYVLSNLFFSCEHSEEKKLPPFVVNLSGPIGGDTILYDGDAPTYDKLFAMKIKNNQPKNNLYFFGYKNSGNREIFASSMEYIRIIGDSVVSSIGIPEYLTNDTLIIPPGQERNSYVKVDLLPEYDTLVLNFQYSTLLNSKKEKYVKLKYLIEDGKITRKVGQSIKERNLWW